MPIIIEQFLIGNDNYAVLLHDEATGRTASVDAMEAAPIAAALRANNWQLTDILVTHKHIDHVGGIEGLKKQFGCTVYGPAKAAHEIGNLDVLLNEGSQITFGNYTVDVWETPGHCADHISFIVKSEHIAFAGDTLFPLGCGRIFDSDAEYLYKSLQRLSKLPDETQVYCGHEYTLGNLEFALSLEPNNKALQKRELIICELIAQNRTTVPTTIRQEKETNPFLRLDSPEILTNIDMVSAEPVDIFTEIRNRKNRF